MNTGEIVTAALRRYTSAAPAAALLRPGPHICQPGWQPQLAELPSLQRSPTAVTGRLPLLRAVGGQPLRARESFPACAVARLLCRRPPARELRRQLNALADAHADARRRLREAHRCTAA